MWSLFKRKGEESFFSNYESEKLEPLIFSNGKTQADVVKEILDSIEQGYKIILIRGVCGTGKSAIALNLARHFAKTSIAVPIKSLQNQYEEDYTNKNFILRKDGKPLKISVIKGRNNFTCPFMKLNADSPDLPCTIEIREKNLEKLKNFIEMNDSVSNNNFEKVSDIRRMSVAPCCRFWSPLLPSKVSNAALEKASKKIYNSVSGEEYALFQREKGCKYYDQFQNYIDADVLIFNSKKYLIELLMGRKPKTDVDVIDECDEFLDSLAQEQEINLNRLLLSLSNIFTVDSEKREKIRSLIFDINELILNTKSFEVEKLNKTKVLELIRKILENSRLAEDEERNYYNKVVEICYEFKYLLDDTYASLKKVKSYAKIGEEKEICYVELVTINLAQKLQYILDKTNILILMSGTLHSEEVLKDIYGIKNFKIIEAETQTPGTIVKIRTGREKNCKYANFKNGSVTRKQFLESLSFCVEKAKKPALIHVNSFNDLPSEMEKIELKLDNLITKERLLEMQTNDKNNLEVAKFKNKDIDVLFTTKCSRGIDFPGEQCNSIILTRYPYPDINSLFWRILKKERPNEFMEFYMDKSRRELLQKIYRGLRFKEDKIYLLSPDSRVLDAKLS